MYIYMWSLTLHSSCASGMKGKLYIIIHIKTDVIFEVFVVKVLGVHKFRFRFYVGDNLG